VNGGQGDNVMCGIFPAARASCGLPS